MTSYSANILDTWSLERLMGEHLFCLWLAILDGICSSQTWQGPGLTLAKINVLLATVRGMKKSKSAVIVGVGVANYIWVTWTMKI